MEVVMFWTFVAGFMLALIGISVVLSYGVKQEVTDAEAIIKKEESDKAYYNDLRALVVNRHRSEADDKAFNNKWGKYKPVLEYEAFIAERDRYNNLMIGIGWLMLTLGLAAMTVSGFAGFFSQALTIVKIR